MPTLQYTQPEIKTLGVGIEVVEHILHLHQVVDELGECLFGAFFHLIFMRSCARFDNTRGTKLRTCDTHGEANHN